MSLFSKKQTGDAGEDYCVKYLKKKGCEIIARNYRKPYGEIDIIALQDNVLCFVEVKTRRQGSQTRPYEAVTLQKQMRIARTAQTYLNETGAEFFCRFDVCEVIIDPDTLKPSDIYYIENAFEADSSLF